MTTTSTARRAQDLIDAAAAADVIGVDLEAVNFSAEYKDRVFAEFLREYSAGRTPNPDVLCNAEIKFKRVPRPCHAPGRVEDRDRPLRPRGQADERFELLRGQDAGKDQSYFLHRLNQEQLSRVMFPVGELKKSEVRRHRARSRAAEPRQEGLDRHLLHRRAAVPRVPEPLPAEGAGADRRPRKGRTVGEHIGLAFYTIGQRKGIGIGGVAAQASLVRRRQAARLERAGGGAGPRPSAADEARIRLRPRPGSPASRPTRRKARYRRKRATGRPTRPARCERVLESEIRVDFDAPQWAVTPGTVGGALRRRGRVSAAA